MRFDLAGTTQLKMGSRRGLTYDNRFRMGVEKIEPTPRSPSLAADAREGDWFFWPVNPGRRSRTRFALGYYRLPFPPSFSGNYGGQARAADGRALRVGEPDRDDAIGNREQGG